MINLMKRLKDASDLGRSIELDPVDVADVIEFVEGLQRALKACNLERGQLREANVEHSKNWQATLMEAKANLESAEIKRLREGLEAVRIWNDDGNGRIVHSDLADHITAVLSEEG